MNTLLDHRPKISVVTPSFNQGGFLEATLRSVIGQGYSDLEYVVIDGGSSDESVDIIRRYDKDLSYWESEPDRGHAHALNKGFAKTTGEIMCWINSSDMQYPWTLETVAEIFTQLPQVEWIMGVPSHFDRDGRLRMIGPRAGLNVYDVLAAGHYSGGIQQESVFWRRSLWQQAGGQLDESLTCAADIDLWLRFFRLTPLCQVETLLGGFRIHDDRLGDAGDGLYMREAKQLHARFVRTYDRRALRRAGLIRFIGSGRGRVIADGLAKAGILPWYRHPRVVFDFDRMTWIIR